MKALAKICGAMMALALPLWAQSASSPANSAAPDLLNGQFWSPDHDARIQFCLIDGKILGKIVWTQRDGSDIHNQDASKRARGLIGLQIVSGFVPQADGRSWSDGTIYDPDTGNTYHGRMWFDDDRADPLRLRGTVMWGMFGRTQSLDRVKPAR